MARIDIVNHDYAVPNERNYVVTNAPCTTVQIGLPSCLTGACLLL
mgnify:CR=1 FL=1